MIRVANLTKYYGDFLAVEDVSFEIQRGEIVGLLGPNGAGKTSTLRMLTGFLQPSQGTVSVQDLDIVAEPLAIKRLLGYLPESAPLYPDMLVYDYLVYVAGIRGLTPADRLPRLRHLADTCGLREVMHKPIGQLSKGYKQRVGLAHALMGDPEILVLDEPTSGLDPNQIVEIREIIRQIGKEKTIILSTHILSEAEATCDRIMIIHRGRIVADDRTDRLKESAGRTGVIRVALEGAPAEEARSVLGELPGVERITLAESDNGLLAWELECALDRDPRRDVYRRLKQTDWVLVELSRQTRSLETVFRELTREN